MDLGQESLRRNGVAIMANKKVQNAVLGCNLKNDRIISVRFQGKPFNVTVIQVCAPTTYAKEAEVDWFYEDLQNHLELTQKEVVLCIIRNWNGKVGSQGIPRITGKFGFGVQNEAGQKLTEFCQENTLFFNNRKDDSTHGHHQTIKTEIRFMFFRVKYGEALYYQ